MQSFRNCLTAVGVGLLLLLHTAPRAWSADEAELQVWEFKTQGAAWSGNGPLKHGVWEVKDHALRLRADGKLSPYISKNEVLLPADKANVVQIRMDAGPASKCQFWFTTGLSPASNHQKMVEFDLKPNAGLQEITLDLKDLATWKDQIASLRFSFQGVKAGDELSVQQIRVLYGEKISTPLVYTAWRVGQKQVVREFRLGCLFNNGMILQRGCRVPVWGRAKAGEEVTVEFAGQKKTAKTNDGGKWEVTLDALAVSAEPRSLTAASNVPGHRVELTGILVGDVWLCGGQSNMGGCALDNLPPEERRKELLETEYPNLRYLAMPGMHRDSPASNDLSEDSLEWRCAQGKSRAVSAVGYYLGQAIHASQKIPVGLLFTIKAGSQVEQWLDQQTLTSIFTPEELNQTCGTHHLASGLFNGMVAPIPPFPVKGGMWYQGESNADDEFKYMGYYKSLPAMVRLWRTMWGRQLPVLLVQLPAFDGSYPPESWAYIREVQQLTASLLPNMGMAVTFDEGDVKNLHPANKYFVGTRLGLLARARVYGESLEDSGPVFKRAERKGDALVLSFDHTGTGLKGRGELTGFEIRGADGKWEPATASISGASVTVSSPKIPAPAAARYAWANAPKATLFNDRDLPASPFRSDIPAALIELVKKSGSLPGK